MYITIIKKLLKVTSLIAISQYILNILSIIELITFKSFIFKYIPNKIISMINFHFRFLLYHFKFKYFQISYSIGTN